MQKDFAQKEFLRVAPEVVFFTVYGRNPYFTFLENKELVIVLKIRLDPLCTDPVLVLESRSGYVVFIHFLLLIFSQQMPNKLF